MGTRVSISNKLQTCKYLKKNDVWEDLQYERVDCLNTTNMPEHVPSIKERRITDSRGSED